MSLSQSRLRFGLFRLGSPAQATLSQVVASLVRAVHGGILPGYIAMISNIGVDVPRMYMEWKKRILLMYEEWEKQKAYNQAHRINVRHDQKKLLGNQKQITATSSYKNTAGGTTSSSLGKTTGNDKGCDSSGRWTTFRGQGKPMDIDARKQKQHSEGRCFRCDKKGHLSRDCPEKGQQVCAVEVAPTEPLSKDTKIEEVKE